MPKLYDMHIHTEASHDSRCYVCEMAKAQIEKGAKGFAVTDHCGTIDGKDIDNSVLSAIRCAEEYKGQIEVLKGIELGEAIWDYDLAKSISEKFELDVIIGSVHAVRYKGMTKPYSCIDFSAVADETIYSYLSQYFDDVLETVENASIDIMAHLTCPVRYINGKYGRNIDVRVFGEKIERILQVIIDKHIAMEINTSGFDSGMLMPDVWIIEKYRDMGGVLITLGSDAHVSANASKGFEEVAKILKEKGFDKCFYYKDRKPLPYEI